MGGGYWLLINSSLQMAHGLIHIALLLDTSSSGGDGSAPFRDRVSPAYSPLIATVVASQSSIESYIPLDSRITVLEAAEMSVDCQRIMVRSSQKSAGRYKAGL